MASVSTERAGDHLVVKLTGPCHIEEAGHLDQQLSDIIPEPAIGVRIDLAGVDALDTAGAWVVHRNIVRLRDTGHTVRLVHHFDPRKPPQKFTTGKGQSYVDANRAGYLVDPDSLANAAVDILHAMHVRLYNNTR